MYAEKKITTISKMKKTSTRISKISRLYVSS